MDTAEIQTWIAQNPTLALTGAITLSVLIFFLARLIIGKGLFSLAKLTRTRVDDIIIHHLKPFRIAWIAPLVLISLLAHLAPDYQVIIQKTALFFILWVTALTVNSLLNAVNEIYESNPNYSGVAIQGYLDLVKILVALVAIILTISLFTDQSPVILLSGLGAVTAILLVVFHDTILSLVASVQIAAHDLIKEGDWIEVPSYDADGDVINMSLHTIKIQNFDKTITVIPTFKMVDVAYKNWRGMQESGGRRIKRSLHIDQASIRFCDEEMLNKYKTIDLIQEQLEQKIASMQAYRQNSSRNIDSPLDGPQITNIEIFRLYIQAYLHHRDDLHQNGMDFLIRSLDPSPTGLPVEVYVFTRTTEWREYELTQAEIFDHLIAAAQYFDLRLFQEPTGMDFSTFAAGVRGLGRSDGAV